MAKKNRNSSAEPVQENESTSADDASQPEKRRAFLKTTLSAGIAVCAAGAPICAGSRTVLAPVFQAASSGKFYPLAEVSTLTEKPQKFSVVDDKRDAWTTLPEQKIGSVFLRKVGDQVQAFHTLCPHAGCMIQVGKKKNPKSGAEEEMFYCPCHAAHFDFNGERLDAVSPRNLDSLDVKVENGQACVKFQNFVFGISEKKS